MGHAKSDTRIFIENMMASTIVRVIAVVIFLFLGGSFLLHQIPALSFDQTETSKKLVINGQMLGATKHIDLLVKSDEIEVNDYGYSLYYINIYDIPVDSSIVTYDEDGYIPYSLYGANAAHKLSSEREGEFYTFYFDLEEYENITDIKIVVYMLYGSIYSVSEEYNLHDLVEAPLLEDKTVTFDGNSNEILFVENVPELPFDVNDGSQILAAPFNYSEGLTYYIASTYGELLEPFGVVMFVFIVVMTIVNLFLVWLLKIKRYIFIGVFSVITKTFGYAVLFNVLDREFLVFYAAFIMIYMCILEGFFIWVINRKVKRVNLLRFVVLSNLIYILFIRFG